MKSQYYLQGYFQNKRGSALIVVLLVLVVLSIIGIGLLTVTAGNFRLTSFERDYQGALYIAEAGANYKLNKIIVSVEEAYESTDTVDDFFAYFKGAFNSELILDTFEPNFGSTPIANITVIGERNKPATTANYSIISEGNISGRKRRVEQKITVSWSPKAGSGIPDNMALFSNATIDMSGSATINGTVVTNAIEDGAIKLAGRANINGDIYVGPGAGSNVLKLATGISVSTPIPQSETTSYDMPQFPSYPSLPSMPNTRIALSQWNYYDVILNGVLRIDNWVVRDYGYVLELHNNYYFPEIRINQNYTLDIDVGNSDRAIVVDHLNLINGHIKLHGTGSLTIYVTDKITMGSSSTINNTANQNQTEAAIEKVNIYLKGSSPAKTISLAGGQKINASLYAENADIFFTAGGGFQGHLITGGKSVIIKGGASVINQVIYAPNASMRLEDGGNVIGCVIVNTLYADGGTSITYQPTDVGSLPFFPPSENSDSPANKKLIQISPSREK